MLASKNDRDYLILFQQSNVKPQQSIAIGQTNFKIKSKHNFLKQFSSKFSLLFLTISHKLKSFYFNKFYWFSLRIFFLSTKILNFLEEKLKEKEKKKETLVKTHQGIQLFSFKMVIPKLNQLFIGQISLNYLIDSKDCHFHKLQLRV